MRASALILGLAASVAYAQSAKSTSTFTGVASGSTTASESLNSVSVLAILATALPTSLLDLAITNGPAASSVIASEFAAGDTPAWFTRLPSDVQTYLVPITTIKQAPAILISALPTEGTSLQAVSYIPTVTSMRANSSSIRNGTMTMRNGTHNATSMRSSSRMSTTAMMTSMVSVQSTSTTHNGAEQTAKAVMGFGALGLAGLMGLMAL